MVRQCFLTGELIFFAEERAKRPQNFRKLHVESTPSAFCPFCLENDYLTPKEVFSTPDRRIRIVPNKYPFISRNDETHYGIHDVVIDTANHDERLYKFSDEHMNELIKTLKNRVFELQKDKNIVYVQVFKNDGIDAGASQSHSHWQIASLSVFPPKYQGIKNVLEKYYNEKGECYFCGLKKSLGEQIIEENENFLAYVPTDAKFPYEMYIIPKEHISNIVEFNDAQVFDMGRILRHCVKRLAAMYTGISYNICFFNSPKKEAFDEDFSKYMHFHIQIIPRIGHMAGFEFSTGCYINSVLPEKAADVLKKIDVETN